MAGTSSERKASNGADKNKINEDLKKKAELKEKIKQRVASEERAFRIVERLIEPGINEEEFVQAAWYIDPNHYEDIVEERSITSLCGYPLCDNKLSSVPKQKYHISTRSNKVYDMTNRKKFCCGICYKASTVYAGQLSSTPVWLRGDLWVKPSVDLFKASAHSKGLDGEEAFSTAAQDLKRELEIVEKEITNPRKDTQMSVDAPANQPKSALKKNRSPMLLKKQISFSEFLTEHIIEKENEEEEAEEKGEASKELTEKLQKKILMRKLSLQEAPTPEVFLKGTETTNQAAATFQRRESAVGEVTDVTSVRDMILLDSDDNAECGAMEGEQKPKRKKSISQAAQMVRKLSTGPGDGETTEGKRKRVSVVCKSSPIQEAVRRKSVGSQLTGVKSLKELLKAEIQSLNQNEMMDVTDHLAVRVHERSKSLTEPPTPDIYTKGMETVSDAMKVGACKGGSLGEMNAVISEAHQRIDQYKTLLGQREYTVDVFGKSHPQDVSSSMDNKSQMLMDMVNKKAELKGPKGETSPKRKSSGQVHYEVYKPLRKASDGFISEETPEQRTPSFEEVMANVRRLTAQMPDVPMESMEESGKAKVPSKTAVKKRPKLTAMQLLKASLFEWKTPNTVKWLSKKDSSTAVTESEVASFEEKHQDLCRRVDTDEFELMDSVSDASGVSSQKPVPSIEELKTCTNEYALKVHEFLAPGKKTSQPEKRPDKEIVLPLIDSHSQMATRRKIVLSKVNKAISELLLPLRMSVIEVADYVRQLVHTFSFTSSNIVLRPAEWTLVGFILLKLVALRNPEVQKGFETPYASNYFRAMILSASLLQTDIDSVINFMSSDAQAS